MSQITDEEIAGLIACPKRIVSVDKKMWVDGKFTRQNMVLESVAGQLSFRVFVRCSTEFTENFSIGLVYHPKTEARSATLLRCNGKHGSTKTYPHHAEYHVHIACAEDLNRGILEPRLIETDVNYASFIDARAYFFRRVGIENAEDSFPGTFQRRFPYSDGEPP